jgi:hypothetical protein
MKTMQRGAIAALLVLIALMGCENATTTSPQPPEVSSNVDAQSDWKTIEGEGVSLSLPSYYEGGNPSTDLEEIEAKLSELGPEYSQQIDAIRQNPAAIALLAFDPQMTTPGQVTNVNIIPVVKPEGVTLQDFVAKTAEQLSAGVEVIEQGVVQVNNNDVGRIIAQDEVGGAVVKPLMYFIPDEERFWVAIYATTANEFEQRLPDFEKSIQSFNVQS